MRLLPIVAVLLLVSASSSFAQQAEPDRFEPSAAADSAASIEPVQLHYPVARHALIGSAAGAALFSSLLGTLSVLCSAPICPRLDTALRYGAVAGALTGAAVGAVSGLNSGVTSTSDPRLANR